MLPRICRALVGDARGNSQYDSMLRLVSAARLLPSHGVQASHVCAGLPCLTQLRRVRSSLSDDASACGLDGHGSASSETTQLALLEGVRSHINARGLELVAQSERRPSTDSVGPSDVLPSSPTCLTPWTTPFMAAAPVVASGSWMTPVDIFMQGMLTTHDVTATPWWLTIVGATVFVRSAMLPLTIRSMHASAKLFPIIQQVFGTRANA
eukprot:1179956-Prorocentrum_minimum.AAC.3